MSMTPDHMRAIALALPEAVESAHMGHPDFRVRGKIFATLSPQRGLAMAKLTPEQQEVVCAAEPAIFAPVPGGWGRRGSTHIRLAAVDETTLARALMIAWRNVAPRRVVATQPRRAPMTGLGARDAHPPAVLPGPVTIDPSGGDGGAASRRPRG